ncbi:MAG: hypothetical protein LBL56_02435 [Treponema sp.]|jgi:hypothetical protein|nr:hypothetical protein [Treponema sp.]
MSEEAVRESQTKLDFEKVWAMFQETRQMMQESSRELDRRFQETDSRFKETDRKMQETDNKISRLGSRIGDIVEQLIAPNILEKFNHLGYSFGKVAPRVKYTDSQGHYLAEVDPLLENGDTVLVVEVKTNLTTVDVKDHVKRMEKLRRYADEHQDGRKLLGAVAGAIAADEAKAYAVKQGFFVLEQSGDTVKISVPTGFTPREW